MSIDLRSKNELINSYGLRLFVRGISFDGKAMRKTFQKLDSNSINEYMTKMLSSDINDTIIALNDLGIKSKLNKLTNRINMIIAEMKKHYPNSEIKYNKESNVFSVTGSENVTLKLVKDGNKYNVQKVDTQNTNLDSSNNKGKKYTLSNGKQSSKLFIDNDI